VAQGRHVQEADRVVEVEVAEHDAQPVDALQELRLGDQAPQAAACIEDKCVRPLAQENARGLARVGRDPAAAAEQAGFHAYSGRSIWARCSLPE
jgi:hypothetical protein